MKQTRQILNLYYPVCIRVLVVISFGTINIIIKLFSKVWKFQPQTSILQFYTFNIMHRKWQCVRMVFCPINILSANVWGFFFNYKCSIKILQSFTLREVFKQFVLCHSRRSTIKIPQWQGWRFSMNKKISNATSTNWTFTRKLCLARNQLDIYKKALSSILKD